MAAFTRAETTDRAAFDAHSARCGSDTAMPLRVIDEGNGIAGGDREHHDGRPHENHLLDRSGSLREVKDSPRRTSEVFLSMKTARPPHARGSRTRARLGQDFCPGLGSPHHEPIRRTPPAWDETPSVAVRPPASQDSGTSPHCKGSTHATYSETKTGNSPHSAAPLPGVPRATASFR